MKTDRYTKAVLTVIALCLIWMSLGGPALLPVVGAQSGATDVVIVGWRDAGGEHWRLPVTQRPRSTSASSLDREREDKDRALGARLPVVTP